MTYATRFRKPVGADIDATGWYTAGDGFGSVYPENVVPGGPASRGELTHVAEDWNLGSGDADYQQPVYAVGNGTVVYMDSPSGWQGQVIVIRHELAPGMSSPSGGQFVYSFYAHLEGATVALNDTVEIGQQIAQIGDPATFSAHLHFEMRDSWSGFIDDGYALDATGAQVAGDRGWFDPSSFIAQYSADAVDDDFADSALTSGRIKIGVVNSDQAWGHLDARPAGQFDSDWFAVDLEAGKTYTFALRGADTAGETQGAPTLADPSLRIRDPLGNQITWDGQPWVSGLQTAEDGAGGNDVRVSFTAAETGTYHLVAFSGTGATGSYRLSGVESAAPVVIPNSGGEFLVNTETLYSQYSPTIAKLSGDRFIVTWFDQGGSLGDGSGRSISAKIFNANGAAIGGEFRVNTQTLSDQQTPDVTSLTGGGFVVTWEDYSGTFGDSSSSAIKAKIYDSDGALVQDEFLVNTQTSLHQSYPSITSLLNGGFIVTWGDQSTSLGDASGWSIKAKIFNANGALVQDEFRVNTQTLGLQTDSHVATLTNGNFVVTWTDESGTLGDTDGRSVKAKIYDPSGVLVKDEFLINTNTGGYQFIVDITSLNSGGFVVAWTDSGGTLGDSSSYSIKAKIFNAAGTMVKDEFLVNTQTTGSQAVPSVVPLAGGGFVVSWQDASSTLGDSFGNSIKAKIFDESGAMVKDEFLVNSETSSDQYGPQVAP